MMPLRIQHFQLSRAAPEDVIWLKQTLERASQAFATRIDMKPGGRLRALPHASALAEETILRARDVLTEKVALEPAGRVLDDRF